MRVLVGAVVLTAAVAIGVTAAASTEARAIAEQVALEQGGGGRQGGGGQGRQGGGAPLQNLQVLPKDMTRQQVTMLMRTFTAALGVECTHCHTGTPQERALDDKPEKGIARKMIQMVAAINDTHLKDVGDAAVAQKVTCFTCHRGSTKPLSAPAGGGGTE